MRRQNESEEVMDSYKEEDRMKMFGVVGEEKTLKHN